MNAQRAVTFLSMCAAGNVQAAFDEYVADDFVHHNAYFPSDRQSLLTAMAESSATNPNKEFNVKHVIEQGDKVAVMSEVVRADDVVRYAVTVPHHINLDEIVIRPVAQAAAHKLIRRGA